MRQQFEFLMDNPDEPRFAELRALLLRPFEEKTPAPARAQTMGG